MCITLWALNGTAEWNSAIAHKKNLSCDLLHEGFLLRLSVARLLSTHLQQKDQNKAWASPTFYYKNVQATSVDSRWLLTSSLTAPPCPAQEALEAQP